MMKKVRKAFFLSSFTLFIILSDASISKLYAVLNVSLFFISPTTMFLDEVSANEAFKLFKGECEGEGDGEKNGNR